MAGPLTQRQFITLFYIIECPYATQANTVYGEGLVAETHSVAGSARAVYTLVTNYLTANVYTSNDVYTELTTLLDDYYALGYDMTTIQQGAVGNIQGVNDDVNLERDEISRRVRVIVPFWRAYEQMLRRGSGGSGGAFVPVTR